MFTIKYEDEAESPKTPINSEYYSKKRLRNLMFGSDDEDDIKEPSDDDIKEPSDDDIKEPSDDDINIHSEDETGDIKFSFMKKKPIKINSSSSEEYFKYRQYKSLAEILNETEEPEEQELEEQNTEEPELEEPVHQQEKYVEREDNLYFDEIIKC